MYAANGGYAALKDAARQWRLGRRCRSQGAKSLGPAGPRAARVSPRGTKWGFVRANEGPRYLAVNGDEGEPGTFKDRYYLERTPHVFLEGMLIAAWAVEAEKAFIYMRDEYPAVLKILAHRDRRAGSGGRGRARLYRPAPRRGRLYLWRRKRDDRIASRASAAIPRHRPPFVAQVGIFGRADAGPQRRDFVLGLRGSAAKAPRCLNSGTEKNGRKGLRSYSVSGRVEKSGRASAARRFDHHRHHRSLRRHGWMATPSRPISRAAPRRVCCPRR